MTGCLRTLLIFIAAVFLLAGFVKGVIGLGLPTVSMGLLAVAMPPAHALAIVIAPGILTNIWQTFAGPYFLGIVKRLWPLLLGLAIGIRLDGDMMTGPYARYGTVVIGVLLVTMRSSVSANSPSLCVRRTRSGSAASSG